MHRAMHPWRTTTVPDIGKFLYRQVDRSILRSIELYLDL